MVWESKYVPLQNYLAKSVASNLPLSFEEIERILGFALPKSAYTHQAWWGNNVQSSRHTRAWMDIGWRTSNLNLETMRIEFVRA